MSGMMEVSHAGFKLCFPFASPYESQVELAKLALDAMLSSSHAVLESPTGTGKTMAMLAAAAAFVQGHQGEAGPQSQRRTVVYASRTHGQLAQVAAQFRKWRQSFETNAHNVNSNSDNMNNVSVVPRGATIGSRDQLCVHEKLSEKSSMEKNALCRVMVKNHSCAYKLNLEKYEEHSRSSDLTDIEDLMRSGRSHRVCPYYLSRDNATSANILFVPYNYLLERSVRETLNFDLEQSVVIVDEAHNINAVCEDAASVDFAVKDLAMAIKEIDIAIAHIQSKQDDDCGNDNGTENNGRKVRPFGASRSNDDEEDDFELSLEDACSMKQLLLNLETRIEKRFYGDNNEDEKEDRDNKDPGQVSYLTSTFISSGFIPSNVPRVLHLLLRTQDLLALLHSRGRRESGQGLRAVTKVLRLIFESDESELQHFYRVHNHKEEKRLSIWCFHSLVALRSLLKSAKVRSIIFTSGTLKPIETFGYELGLDLKTTRSFGHVVDTSSQLLAISLSTGPDSKTPLIATFEHRSNPMYLRSLGGSLVSLVPKVKHGGSLVFFPSHSFMSTCIEFWKNDCNVWNELSRDGVEVIVEPRKKDEFNAALKKYSDQVTKSFKPTCLMAVCRGRAAEGLDFSDAMARAVFVVGLPFPNLKDPRVVMKKRFLDNQVHGCNDKMRLSGSEWYSLEAYRAVNQGVGRILRHRNDFGVVVFLDRRFGKGQKARFGLSQWVQGAVRDVDLNTAKADLQAFFSRRPTSNNQIQVLKGNRQDPKNGACVRRRCDPSVLRAVELNKRRKIVVKQDDRALRYKIDELVEALSKKTNSAKPLEMCSEALKSYRITMDMDELKESLESVKEQLEGCDTTAIDDVIAFVIANVNVDP